MSDYSIKIAVAGVGNLTSALVQAIYYYTEGHSEELIHPKLGGFSISDIQLVAAFDIDQSKVGKDLSDAIFSAPNNKQKVINIPKLNVMVNKGPTLDGISEYTEEVIKVASEVDANIVEILKQSKAEFLVINTPSGSNQAVETYAQAALDAGVGVINSTPTKLVRNPEWVKKFVAAGLPLLGDDLQSQAGGTIFHKGVLEVLHEQGIKIEDTYQLDVSGGLEGLTTLDYSRRQNKRKVKEDTIKRSIPYDINVAAGTTDYLDFLGSRRIGHYWIKGSGFLGQEVKIDITMITDDGSNGAASLVDAIRAAKIALARGKSGPIINVCAHLFKGPPSYISRTDAINRFSEFITGERDS